MHSRCSVSISLPRSWEDPSLRLETIFSCFPSLPAGLLLPLASSFPQLPPYPRLAKGMSPLPALVIPELRAGLTASRGGRGTVPHALHDVAGHPRCTGKGMLLLLLPLPFARCKVNCPGWGDTPSPAPANPAGCGVSLPCLLSRHFQFCSNLPQKTT